MDRNSFCVAALAIEATEQQQGKISNIEFNPVPFDERVQKTTRSSTNVAREFLDAVAYIFSQSGASDVVATALEQSAASPNIFTVHVAKNNGDYTRLQALKHTLEEWSRTLNELCFYSPDAHHHVGASVDKDLL